MDALKYVAYYRTSTTRQNLGLEAQRDMCNRYVNGLADAVIIAEYSEQDSGRNNERTALFEAIRCAEANNATLLVAKLDRLTRDVEFGMHLRNTHRKLSIKALNCPDIDNTISLVIMLGIAQAECEFIRQRTRDALAKLKADGKCLDHSANFTADSRAKLNEIRHVAMLSNPANRKAARLALALKAQGVSLRKIAATLNAEGYETRRKGCKWGAQQVSNLITNFEGKI